MGWIRDRIFKTPAKFTNLGNGNTLTVQDINGVTMSLPTSLTESNAYELAWKVAEIFIPIDIVAGKVQKLLSTIRIEQDGKEIPIPSNIKKLLEKPNLYYRFSDIVYNHCFSLMSDGNAYLYPYSLADNLTQDNITGLFLLEPDNVAIKYNSSKDKMFSATEIGQMIDHYTYAVTNTEIKPDRVFHSRYSFITGTKGEFSVKAKSPLYAAQQNVDNLLAAYSARYNVFVNNGMAMIIAPKGSQPNSMATAVNPLDRDKIAEDLNNRKGLVGLKQIKAIASSPVEAVNTLTSIKDLEPFAETYADMEMIGGVYEVDKDLLPRKEGTTYNNKEVAEAKLWNDVAVPMADDFCDILTSALKIKKGKFTYDKSNIGVLAVNRKTEYEGDKLIIDNIAALGEIGYDTKDIYTKILDKYGKQI